MTELKRCPHCGSKAEYVHSMAYDWVRCGNMNCHNTATISVRYWNTRPIEDELNARIVQLEAENERLCSLLHDINSQLVIATDLGSKRWQALNDIYLNGEKHNANWCKRTAQKGLGLNA